MAGKVAEVVPNGSRARGEELPDMAALVTMALEVRLLAMAKTRVWKGEEYPDADYRAALESIRLVAQLRGYLGDKTLTPEQFKMELAKIGLEVRPKLKAAG